MTTQLIPVNEVQTMAIAVAKSGLFGMKTPEQALALMLVAQSEGLHPARAARLRLEFYSMVCHRRLDDDNATFARDRCAWSHCRRRLGPGRVLARTS